MTDTTAKILGKGCQNTGITDELATRYYHQLGSHFVAVVELEAWRRGEDADGNETLQIRIKTIEPVVDDAKTEQVVREIARALHGSRRLKSDGPMLPIDGASDVEPTVEEVVANNPGVIPHDYAATTTGECDVCGRTEDDTLHTLDTPLPDPEPTLDAEEPPVDDQEPDDDGTVVTFSGRSR